jgi:signal transduction histidine kinase
MAEKNIRKHSFQPGAMSIIQMGEELIGHPSTAINELIKNGYDADALNCKVYFFVSKTPSESFAIILDNGNGMDGDTLFGDWLKPSVSSKRKANAKSEVYNRHLLGSKGIGRLAAMALGEIVTVISRKKIDDVFNWITIKRRDFREEKLLSQIEFPGDTITDPLLLFSNEFYLKERNSKANLPLVEFLKTNEFDLHEKGTLIVIESLDDSVAKLLWEEFNQLELLDATTEPYKETSFYKSLATLVTPLNLNTEIQKELFTKKIIQNINSIADKESIFSVEFGTNLLPDQKNNEVDWRKIDPIPVQSVFDYRVYGKVTKEGDVRAFFKYNRLLADAYEEEFNISFQDIIDESIRAEKREFGLFDREQRNETGEYYFDIRIYDLGEPDNLEKLARLAKIESGKKFRNAFKSFQGLRISKNGFGVKPYGEEVIDWVGLSKERVQNPGQNVDTNQILGYVFFYSPENDSIQEKTNREGFLENRPFIQLRNTLSVIFKNLGRKRYNYRLLHGIGRALISKHARPDIEEFLATIKASRNIDQRIVKYSEKFMKEVNTSMDNLEESLSFSERLASLGSGIELIFHEMAQPISGLRTTKSSLDIKKDKVNPEILNAFISDINTLDQATNILVELRQSLQPAIGRTRKKKFKPFQTFIKVSSLYKSDMDDHNITIVADERVKDYELHDLEYAFWIAFLNIINNAVYWIKKSERPGEIRFNLDGESIIISNSGPPIREDVLKYIFNYGVTTRQEKNATGLGLSFTQSILSRNDWEILAKNRANGPAFIIQKIDYE